MVKEGKPRSPKDEGHTTNRGNKKWQRPLLHWADLNCPALSCSAKRRVFKFLEREVKLCQLTDYFLMLFNHGSAKDTARRKPEWIRSNCKVQGARVRQQGILVVLFFLLPVLN